MMLGECFNNLFATVTGIPDEAKIYDVGKHDLIKVREEKKSVARRRAEPVIGMCRRRH